LMSSPDGHLRDDLIMEDRIGVDLSWLPSVFRPNSAPLLVVHGRLRVHRAGFEPSLSHYLVALFEKYTPHLPPMIHKEEQIYVEKAREDLRRHGWNYSSNSIMGLPEQVFSIVMGELPDDLLNRSLRGILFPGVTNSGLRTFVTPNCQAEFGLYLLLARIAARADHVQELEQDLARIHR